MNKLSLISCLILIVNTISAQKIFTHADYNNIAEEKVEFSNMDVKGDILFLPLGMEGLKVLNISDKENISEMTSYTETEKRPGEKVKGEAFWVQVDGTKLYMAFGDLGFKVFDIIDPEMPYVIGSYYRHQPVYCFKIIGNQVFLGLQNLGLEVIDISDLTNIKMALRNNIADYPVRNISRRDQYLVLTGRERGLRIIEFNEPFSDLKIKGFQKDFLVDADIHKMVFTADDNYGIIANDLEGIQVLNLKLPLYPLEIAKAETEGKAIDVLVNQNLAFVAGGKTIEIFDLGNPKMPKKVFEHKNKSKEYQVLFFKDGLLYAGYTSGRKNYGLEIFRVE